MLLDRTETVLDGYRLHWRSWEKTFDLCDARINNRGWIAKPNGGIRLNLGSESVRCHDLMET